MILNIKPTLILIKLHIFNKNVFYSTSISLLWDLFNITHTNNFFIPKTGKLNTILKIQKKQIKMSEIIHIKLNFMKIINKSNIL